MSNHGGIASDNASLPGSRYREIVDYFESAIAQGKYRDGERLPSESQLVKQFGWSRPTVSRAMREMQVAGLVRRRVGSGSFVQKASTEKRLVFGLLFPNLGETFEAIVNQIGSEAQARGHDLLWARTLSDRQLAGAEAVCAPFLHRQVSGVFFAPLEQTPAKDEINQRIVHVLTEAGIAVVLLDCDFAPFPCRSKHDLIGIDNYAAGYLVAQHLLECNCRSIVFVSHSHSAPTVAARGEGVQGALLRAGRLIPNWHHVLDPTQVDQVQAMLDAAHPDGIICANDSRAAELMQSLHRLKIAVPGQIKVAGFDDVQFAKLLRPALTTVHQPCADIGTVALQAMLTRLAQPELPPRQINLPVHLMVRESTVEQSADTEADVSVQCLPQ